MKLGLLTVILAHLLFTQPFVILVVYARMVSFDYAVVESARDLGASPLKAFFTVTLPIIRPTVIGAALIAAALSLDDFVITFFNIGGGNTLAHLRLGIHSHRFATDGQRDRHHDSRPDGRRDDDRACGSRAPTGGSAGVKRERPIDGRTRRQDRDRDRRGIRHRARRGAS